MFWNKLTRPIFALAPMDDVTDFVFRQVIAGIGRPAVFFTEFSQAAGIAAAKRDSIYRLLFHPDQQPIVAQIWGNDPNSYGQAVYRIRQAGFAGVDINMGCPERKITAKGCCAALINQPALATQLIQAAQAAAADPGPVAAGAPEIDVSVKTRIGFGRQASPQQAADWFGTILNCQPAALTVHARTAAQQSEGLADWSYVALAVALRDQISPTTLILGNGDVTSLAQARTRVAETGCDGVMIGRGIFANPFLFADLEFGGISRGHKIGLALKHLNAYQDFWGAGRNYHILKNFFKIYLSGFADAPSLLTAMLRTPDYHSARAVLSQAAAMAEPAAQTSQPIAAAEPARPN